MLRASLFVVSFAAIAGFATTTSAFAGPHHPHPRPLIRAQFGAPPAAARPSRPIVRPVAPIRPIYVGYQQPLFPYYGPTRPIVVDHGPYTPAPPNVTVTLNPVPVVVGIRRAPEAAPVIYRIADGRDGDRIHRQGRHHERRRMAPSAGVHQLEPDTTTPRIVVVRGR